ncbi:MAG: TatD family hydrolase [Rikenellaceae bacterium]
MIDIHTHNPVEEGTTTISAAGIHPWSAEESAFCSDDKERYSAIRKELIAAAEQVDAIGEIGLDFAADVNREAQRKLFIEQLKIATKCRKPVIIHSVRAFDDVMEILSTFRLKVIFHGFIGSAQQMNRAVDRGYFISYGARTFDSPKTVKALRETPLEMLFIETDTSKVAIEEVYEKVVSIRMESLEELVAAIENNFTKIFDVK